jgi:hypothetical protein
MARSWLVLLIVGALFGAPVATAICQATCTMATSKAASVAPEHACHEMGMSMPKAATIQAVHVCGHTDELPAGAQASAPLLSLDALVPAVGALVGPPAWVADARFAQLHALPPPGRTLPILSLRI